MSYIYIYIYRRSSKRYTYKSQLIIIFIRNGGLWNDTCVASHRFAYSHVKAHSRGCAHIINVLFERTRSRVYACIMRNRLNFERTSSQFVFSCWTVVRSSGLGSRRF